MKIPRFALPAAGHRHPVRRIALVLGPVLAAAGIAAAAAAPAAGSAAARPGQPLNAAADSYSTGSAGTLAVDQRHGVLSNDNGGALQLVSHTDPAHGSLTLNPDGSFGYVPQAGFTGDDTFTYTISNAVQLYSTHLPALGDFGGVTLTGGGFGSSLYPDPGHPGVFYGLEDRGPNVGAPDGDRKSTRLNSSHYALSRMPSSA